MGYCASGIAGLAVDGKDTVTITLHNPAPAPVSVEVPSEAVEVKSADVADAALARIDEDEYMSALKEVAASRYRQTKGATEYERKMKTMKSVCSRGYEPALVRKVLNLQDSLDD